MTQDPGEFAQLLTDTARAEGFVLAGVIDIELAMAGGEHSPFSEHLARYDRWLARGYAGAMGYLARGRDRRADPRAVFPGARSMLCVAVPYPRHAAGSPNASRGPRYARYIQGRDYHLWMVERLESVMKRVGEECERRGWPVPGYKVCVDTSAVLERTWAALAGIGWIGKNTLLIHPQHGSYLFLGEVLLDVTTGQGPAPLRNYCGHCERCLKACPTGAITEPGTVDSNRCISYLTLEKRGELPVTPELRAKTGNWIAGCDICQEVCPFNTKPVKNEPELGALPHDSTELRTWRELLEESEEQYRARVRESSLNRIKPAQFRRNLALSLANTAFALEAQRREQLSRELRPLVEARYEAETDEFARAEWARCLEALK